MKDSKLFRNSQEKLLLEGSSSENLNQFAKLYHQQVSNLCFRTQKNFSSVTPVTNLYIVSPPMKRTCKLEKFTL